jgi:triacylglycerol lipase
LPFAASTLANLAAKQFPSASLCTEKYIGLAFVLESTDGIINNNAMAAIHYTRLLLLVQFILAVALAALAVRFGQVPSWLALTFGFGVVLLIRALINANNFRIARQFSSPIPLPYQLSLTQAIKLFLTEFTASMISTSWAMPFKIFATRVAQEPAGLPVLLIHGYGCNSGYWNSLSRRLTQENITHHAVDLEPVLGSIDGFVPIIHRAIEGLLKTSGQDQIVIVAHSMGGLVARAYLRDYGMARIAKVITLGTPHHGTVIANFGRGLNSRQMERSPDLAGTPSAWLSALEQAENPAARSLFVSIYTLHDNIVFPQTTAHLPGARNIELYGIGHVALASTLSVQQSILQEIAQASAQWQPVQAAA